MSLTKDEYQTLLTIGGAEPYLQVNYYFYCDKMPKDVMLRIRFKNGKYLFCYKKLLSYDNGVNVCDEREKEIDELDAKALLDGVLTSADIKTLADVDLPYEYKCVGCLSTYRARFQLNGWTIELDKNEYLGTTDYELECECASGESLKRLKAYLCDGLGVEFKQSTSKSGRFFKRLYGGN